MNFRRRRTDWAIAVALTLAAAPGDVALADSANLHTFHCVFGCPVGAPANDDLVVREIYTLASNPVTKLADWVAYRVTPDTIGPSQDRIWSADSWLAPEETLKPGDYDGAFAARHVDRGHQAPLAAFSGTPFWLDTDILSNITPQSSALNQGSWQRLEAQETALAKSSNIAVYVLTGPLFERVMAPLPAGPALQRLPSGYWKVIATRDGRVSAFVFDQRTPRDADFCTMRASLQAIEVRTRLILFPGPDTPTWRSLDETLGCTTLPPDEPQGEVIGEDPAPVTPDEERWAEAHTVLDLHGDAAFTFMAERIFALTREGDRAGVDRWRTIADKVARLQRGTIQ